jgi:hypothetical protein
VCELSDDRRDYSLATSEKFEKCVGALVDLKINPRAVREEASLGEVTATKKFLGLLERTVELLEGYPVLEKLLDEEQVDKIQERREWLIGTRSDDDRSLTRMPA